MSVDPPIVGLSDEVIRHHVSLHPCRDAGAIAVPCPCDRSVAVACSVCLEPIFVSIQPGRSVCEHAREMLGVMAR